MTTGHKVSLGKSVKIKDGRIVRKTTIFTLKKKRADDREAAGWQKKRPPAQSTEGR